MRKKTVASTLFPTVRRGVLGVTFRDPRRWWYLSELADALGTSPSSLQREVESLAASGILEVRRDGKRTYYRAHAKSAIFKELGGIVRKTMGVAPQIQAALTPLSDRIVLALVYGSVAGGDDRADSDVDVLVVSDHMTLEELYRRLAPVERSLRRKVNPTLYTTDEFRRRHRSRNPFLEEVLGGQRVVLIGSEDGIGSAG
ncbi:MAG TPA: nucleotidyltransferase domain-containing protein [Thermoanaerobaculia bacterium]|jgi:predicted nucleotidyltransferase